ncbi:pantoate--beta-alanine ligase [Paenibacillus sp. PL2-23]|uniref:pantoate--beta-alanine ligase n=1 Tax=Paenibacillus sp. PL2-23 TaxID=2100729 RepID=UPI0030F8B7DF
MKICRTIAGLKQQLGELRQEGKTIGFVPTMGFLHEGHASLMRQAKEQNEAAVLSIFVNPTQFGPNEDFDRYPRDEERDLELAEQNGMDLVFLPSVEEMYPRKPLTSVLVSGVTTRLCGASRPGHFDGVGLIVSKLFHIVQPDRAYFGMKDAQQVAVITQLVEDLNFNVDVVPCPTVREPDGLALSSRNVYLSAQQRSQAVVLSQSLQLAKEWIPQPGMTAGELVERVKNHIRGASGAAIDYVELLRFPSLEELSADAAINELPYTVILALAVKFGNTRLIDNSLYEPIGGVDHV